MTPEQQLYEALLRFLESRGKTLDLSGGATLEIPCQDGQIFSVPAIFLTI